MFNRIGNLASKELIQLTRDVLMLVLIIVGPTLQLALVARATTQGFHHLPVVVIDQDRSQLSRELITALGNTEEIAVVVQLDSPAQLDRWLAQNDAVAAVTLPPGLEADLATGRPQVQIIVDGSQSAAASYALGAAQGAINAVVARRAAAQSRNLAVIIVDSQVRYNPTFNVSFFVISAQLGFIVYQVALIIASLGLTRERELGTLEQLLVTPMRRIELIIGKSIPALVVATINFVITFAIVTQVFHLPMSGSFPLLLGLSLLFIVAEIGWGLMISAISHNQQQAVLFVFVLAMMDVSFSGYTVPIERLPQAMQVVSQFFPLQHYLQIIRGVMLKGSDLAILWPQALALIGLAILSGGIALVALQRRLD
ncbi:MAG TPA: ABC transporter permease [Anaerolineae bacterium]|nr:ABC transporter permease [Anaerolineae bacterium]